MSSVSVGYGSGKMKLRAGPLWMGDDWNLVLARSNDAPISRTWLTHQFWTELRRAGLPRGRFHNCRHGAVSFALAEGVDLHTIQEILGHDRKYLCPSGAGGDPERYAEDRPADAGS